MARERESEKWRASEGTSKVNEGQDGGWIPVIRNHIGQSEKRAASKETFTMFVDNIPENNDLSWLRRTFNKFGVVRDVFILRKRRKRTGNQFGFVRYDCHVAAGMAVSKMNGVWVENVRLFVKEACFGLNEEKVRGKVPRFHTSPEREKRPKQGPNLIQRSAKMMIREKERGVSDGKSYVQVLKGESSKLGSDQRIVLHAQPIGNGWLYRSAVAVMRRVVPMRTLQASLSLENEEVQFQPMGGRVMLITFQNQETRDSMSKGQWMNHWFDNVKPWRGEPTSHERFVWLSCRGIPLNAWNIQTFTLIAELWGCFIMVDESTLKEFSFAEGKILIATQECSSLDKWIQIEVAGIFYDVKVTESSSFINPEAVMEDQSRKEKALDDDVGRFPG